MNGALRVMVLFFGAMGVQRVLLGAGALFVLVSIFVPQQVRIVLLLLGLGIPLVPTLFAGGVLLRYFIAPIHMRLIPGARAQVLGGMLLSTLAVATVATLGLWGAGVDTDLLPILWLRIATAGSVVLLTQFVVATSVPGMTFWFVAIASLGPLTASAGTRDFLQFIGQNESLLVAIFVISWITFAPWFLRARAIRSPNEASPHGNRILKVSHSQASAVRAFLFGNPSIGGQFAGSFLMVAVLTVIWVLMALASGQALSFADALTRSINPTLMLALYAGIGGFLVVRRSKSLWLRGGRDRMGVFRTCEAQAWSHYFATVTSILVLVAIACLIAPASRWWYAATLIFQMCGGVWLLYLGLMHVRGWRAFDIITTFVLFGAWILMFANLQFVIDRPWTLPILVVAMAAVALALRFIAAHRWRRIDWLVCKPPRPMPRMRPTALARD